MKFQKNDIIMVTIEDMGNEGFGIGRADGFTLFVKDTVVGDRVEARIVKVKKNYAYARLEKVLSPSPFRVEPECAYHRQCGGCQLQPLSYEKQLQFKQKKIRGNLIRIGGLAPEYVDEHMEPIVGMEEPFRYRNKAQYPVGTDREGNIVTGFYAGRTHTIIANTNCLLGPAEYERILKCILQYMRRNGVSAYKEEEGTGLVRHILIRKGFSSGEIMVCIVINKSLGEGKPNKTYMGDSAVREGTEETYGENLPGRGRRRQEREIGNILPCQEDLLSRLAEIEGMTSVSVNVNTGRTNVILGKEVYTLWGKNTISDVIRVRDMKQDGYPFTGKELVFHISPLSFYQINPIQTEKLYSLALEYAGLCGEETVWDLYCGIGTISLFLAGSAKKVYGVEIVPQAIEDARENARRNGITNAEFFVGKSEEVLRDFYQNNMEESHPDVIVVDPPRKGCDEACLEAILAVQPEKVVYVSCDPATLARDIKILCHGGYEVRKVRGVDQFGMTVHVETVCLLSNRKSKPDTHVKLSLSMDDYYRIKEEGKNNQI